MAWNYGYGPMAQQQFQAPAAVGAFGAPPPGIPEDLWQWFNIVDDDGNGEITTRELQQALLNGNWSPFNEETCRLMIGMFDHDRSGTINVHEFTQLWRYIQEWKRCFDAFDTDRSGTIDTKELHQALTTFGYRLSQSFCSLVVQKFDRRGRGCIDFDDFIQSCVMIQCLTNAFRQKDVRQQGVIQLHYEQFLEMVLENGIRDPN